MHNKFEINRTKIKGGSQSGRKVVTHNSKSDLPLVVHVHLLNMRIILIKVKTVHLFSYFCSQKRSHVGPRTGSYTSQETRLMMKPAKVDVHAQMPAILFANPSIAPQVS